MSLKLDFYKEPCKPRLIGIVTVSIIQVYLAMFTNLDNCLAQKSRAYVSHATGQARPSPTYVQACK